jgi:hypothetical protein
MSLAGAAEPAAPQPFRYDRALAPLLWAFASIMAIELAVVHLIVSALWSRTAALILSLLSLATLAWIILLIRSLKRLPVLVDEAGVTMRVGALKGLIVPRERIAAVRTDWPREMLKQRSVLNLALLNYPNVMLDLDPPIPSRRRSVRSVAHRLDNPGGFVAAVERLIRSGKDEEPDRWSIA